MAYTVYCVHADRGPWVRSLRDHLDAAVAVHGDPAGTVQVREGYVPECQRDRNSPAVAVYLGSPAGAASAECRQQVDEALADRVLMLPVVDDERNFKAHTPAPLYPFNGEAWLGDDALPRIVRFVHEALGLEERQRMVFLSHRRSDARAVAEQLHDELIKNRFWPFVDRFDIDPAEDVQQRIHAALEETAFVVLVESPAAVTSQWVLEELPGCGRAARHPGPAPGAPQRKGGPGRRAGRAAAARGRRAQTDRAEGRGYTRQGDGPAQAPTGPARAHRVRAGGIRGRRTAG